MKQGYKLNEIDDMDIHYYLNLLSEDNENNRAYIDDIF